MYFNLIRCSKFLTHSFGSSAETCHYIHEHRIANISIWGSDLNLMWHVINIIQCSVVKTNKKQTFSH